MRNSFVVSIVLGIFLASGIAICNDVQKVEYKVLATSKTSTTQKEMQEAADAGFRWAGVMGGDTAFGGDEVVSLMYKNEDTSKSAGRYQYRLLATSKTSTMQKEMQEAGDAGFEYSGQTVFKSMFGGKEVVVILEKDTTASVVKYEYKLLATSKTSTMQKEVQEVGDAGFEFVGMTVASTKFGGNELVTIFRKKIQ